MSDIKEQQDSRPMRQDGDGGQEQHDHRGHIEPEGYDGLGLLDRRVPAGTALTTPLGRFRCGGIGPGCRGAIAGNVRLVQFFAHAATLPTNCRMQTINIP